jgi:hypothetical protein
MATAASCCSLGLPVAASFLLLVPDFRRPSYQRFCHGAALIKGSRFNKVQRVQSIRWLWDNVEWIEAHHLPKTAAVEITVFHGLSVTRSRIMVSKAAKPLFVARARLA